MSNFDGPWRSYLGDFDILKLNAIWGNTRGCPITFFLIGEGSSNQQEFQRYAHHSQFDTLLWYSRYPKILLKDIHTAEQVCENLKFLHNYHSETGDYSPVKKFVKEHEVDKTIRQLQ